MVLTKGIAATAAISFICLGLGTFAQDPFKVAPDSYKLQFENEWVKVTRVHYPPHSIIPVHDHTKTDAAYVYLNDSGKVVFKHDGLSYGAVTRPETKAGSFRLYRAVKETHSVENPNDTPSHFLRVEFKTISDTKAPLRGKYFREPVVPGRNSEQVQFENDQIRVTRLICATACAVVASNEPSLIVALTPARIGASSSRERLESGESKWVSLGQSVAVENAVLQPAEVLRFDLKSGRTK